MRQWIYCCHIEVAKAVNTLNDDSTGFTVTLYPPVEENFR